MIIKLLTEHHLEFLSLKRGCIGWSEFTHVKMPHCWKSHAMAHMGAQWLSGRVFDSRPKGRGFEPHRRHCVVVLEQDTFILAKYWFNPGRPVPHN